MNYTDMTDEEYDALDEELTRTIPEFGPNDSDWLAQREIRLLGLKNKTIQYLLTKAKASNKSPVQIIDELVSEKITADVI